MITVTNLSMQFDDRKVLENISLNVKKGESIAIMGPSGCGKTTLLRCISGLIKPTSGQIVINGSEITKLTEKQLNLMRRKLGMVFQYAALFDYMTVGENIAFGLQRHTKMKTKEIEQTVTDALKTVGLEDIEGLYPSQISGGMRKRVGLARALVLEPDVLLFDEPTSGLDPVTAYQIDALICDLQKKLGVTSVVVSHDVNSVFRIANRVYMLADGAVLAEGTPKELKENKDPQVRTFLDSAMADEIVGI